MGRRRQKSLLSTLFLLSITCVFALIFLNGNTVSALSDTHVTIKRVKTIPLAAVGNSATIAGKYFIYTDGKLNGGKTNIYRCDWPNITNCKQIIHNVDVGHANITDSVWGSQYFRVIDFHPNNSVCFDSIEAKKVSSSKCGSLPPDWDNRKKSGGNISSTKWQDLTVYGDYLLRGYASANRIEIRKNNKEYKVLKPSCGGELEGVFVDGSTGKIYFTTATKRKDNKYSDPHNLNLYRIASFSLPALEQKSKSSGDSSSSSKPSASSSESGGGAAQSDNDSDNKSSVQLAPDNDHQCATILSFWCNETESNGEATIKDILSFVIGTFTVGITVLGTIGIIWCGYLIMTARDNSEQISKAKKRLLEIVIGIVMWVLMATLMSLLLPKSEEATESLVSGTIVNNSNEK